MNIFIELIVKVYFYIFDINDVIKIIYDIKE